MNGTLFKVSTVEAPSHSYSALYCAHCNKELGEFMVLSAIVILGDQRLLLGVYVFSWGFVWVFFSCYSHFLGFVCIEFL